MKLPSSFQKNMKLMYDKEFEIYSSIEEIDEELNSIVKKGSLKERQKGNIHYTSKEAVLRDFGLNLETSLYFTCEKTSANENDFLTYKNVDYKIVGKIENDSHTKIFLHGV